MSKNISIIFLFFICLNFIESNNFLSFLQASDSLKEAFKDKFKVGTAIGPTELNAASSFIIQHFNSLTPANELKPDSIINQQGCQQNGNNVNTQVWFRDGITSLLRFCEKNKISLRGHTFCWHSQTPDWFFRENFQNNGNYVSKDIMNQRLESFIKNTFEIFAKDFPQLDLYAYDICNEVFVNGGGGLRPATESKWFQVYGDDSYIINAFTYARKYAPEKCKLYLNDFNEYMPAKTQNIYDMAMKLKELGIIDGIGMQSHLDVGYPSAQLYETAVNKFVSTGLDVQITELDITTNNEQAQASLYKEILSIAVKNAEHISAVVFWGTQDENSWRRSQNPLPFHNGYKPKQAYYSIMQVVGQ